MSLLYTPEIELIRERVLRLQDHRAEKGRPLSQGDIALAIGMSAATVSHFLNHKEQGDVEKVAGLLKHLVEREEVRDESGLVKIPFVETRQAKKFVEAYTFCHQYGRMAAVLGGSGFGKSRTIAELVARDRSLIVIRAWGQLGASGVVQDLCEAIRVSERGLQRALMKRIKARLCPGGRPVGRCLIIDDAHTLRFAALDALRYIYDETSIGLLLVGIHALRRHLVGISEETEQLASRVSGRIWELPEVSERDVEKILRAVMHERDVEAAMAMLHKDPQLLASHRRTGNFLEIAGSFAKKGNGTITLDHLRQAMRIAA